MTDFGTWYRVTGSRFLILVSNDAEILDAIELQSRAVQPHSIRLRITTGKQRIEDEVFYVGARGVAFIAGAIHAFQKKPSAAILNSKMASLFRGDPIYVDMLAATCRALFGQSAAGEASYFLSCATIQLAQRPFLPVEFAWRSAETDLPFELSPFSAEKAHH